MASSDGTGSFEAMIHADRARKKNEDLANQIFGRSKSSQNVKKSQKEPRSPSLASRMGVQKRHSSTSTPTQKSSFNPPSRPSSTTPSHRNNAAQTNVRANRIATEIETGSANVTVAPSRANAPTRPARNGTASSQPATQQGPGLTIKGSAGPFTLHASNFDPGTTEADIEAALHHELFDDAGNNCLLSCRLVSTRPSVVAEMVFTEKSVADRIIGKFNNLKADGRILKVEYVKSGLGSGGNSRRSTTVNSAVAQSIEPANVVEDAVVSAGEGDMEMEEVEITTEYPATTSYDHEREAADRDRRDRDRDRDGYVSGGRRDERRDDRVRDDRDRRRDDRDRDRDRDRRDDDRDRERDRDRDRERDRDRDRERDRDRDYDQRDSQSFSQSQSQSQSQPQPYNNNYSQRPPGPAYGNGYNRPPRGGYGGYSGRGYGFPRGGGYAPRGGSGGYRGSFGR